MKKISRNDPCPCGSGKKYKHCCSQNGKTLAADISYQADSINNTLQSALAYYQAGRFPQAEAICQEILRVAPNHHGALHLLGVIAYQMGKAEVAIQLISNALSFKPDFAEAHNNLGNILKNQGKPDEAIASYRRALMFKPDYAIAYYNLADVLTEQGSLDEAVTSYRKALMFKPDFSEVHNNLGNILKDQGKLDEAISSYRNALTFKPDIAEAYNNLGLALHAQGKLDAAYENYSQALSIKPGFAEAYSNLGIALRDQGKLDAAVESYHKALSIKPDFPDALSSLLYLHAFTRNISTEAECRLATKWENTVLSESEKSAARDRVLSANGPFDRHSRGGRKLRLGIVSAEIGQHAVAEFLEPLLEQLDRNRFHITLYPTAARSGSRTARILKLVDDSKSLVAFSDSAAADRIRADRIDVLIDTTGHMSGCRLGIFAHRAAPVQCHYIGYHGTTGLT